MGQQFSLNLNDKRRPVPFIAEGSLGELGGGVWPQDPDKAKELGQVETPTEIATVMASWLLTKKPKAILDPAVGPGALLRACHANTKGKYKPELIGVELDADTVTLANHRVPKGTQLMEGDYLLLDIDPVHAIIANPHYVKATTYAYSNEEWEAIEATLGLSLDRLTNVYALFVLKIWHDLANGGRASIIVPAEFLNANYGDEIKDALLKITKPAGIAVFNPSVSLFDKALTTSAIIFFDKSKDSRPVWSSIVNNLAELRGFINFLNTGERHPLQEHSIVDVSGWSNTDKWINPLLRAAQGPAIAQPHGGLTKNLRHYYRCKRGIATGANDYFCLSVPEITEHRLSMEDVTPCITKAADAASLFFTAEDFNTLREGGRRCYLLDPTSDSAAIKAYLRKGEELKIHERFLTKSRKQWYKPERREAAQIWVGVFSRERVGYVINEARIKNLTCFHGLYATKAQAGLDVLTLLFLNSRYGAEAFASISRFYGSGLNKVEPKDVEAMPCPEFPVLPPDTIAAIKHEMVSRTEAAETANTTPNFDDLCQLHLGL